MVINATFNNISVISRHSVLLVEETGVPWENHRPAASQTNFITWCCIEYTSPWAGFKLTILVVIGTDYRNFSLQLKGPYKTGKSWKEKQKNALLKSDFGGLLLQNKIIHTCIYLKSNTNVLVQTDISNNDLL
jgi:hypothetical protein